MSTIKGLWILKYVSIKENECAFSVFSFEHLVKKNDAKRPQLSHLALKMITFQPLLGIVIFQLKPIVDHRGSLTETFRLSNLAEHGIICNFVQENHVVSRQHTLRGLHYQIQSPQGKLIRVISGAIFDVVVDIKKESPFFGKWFGVELSAENMLQLWVPPGFAHGYYVLTNRSEVIYKTTEEYAPELERTILWCDPHLDIRWPMVCAGPPILSEKDLCGLLLQDAEVYQGQM